jgi:hypothetical protein
MLQAEEIEYAREGASGFCYRKGRFSGFKKAESGKAGEAVCATFFA